jgi:nucleotide-binding universal stress UspA family protein
MPPAAENSQSVGRPELDHSRVVALDQHGIRRILVCLDQSPLSEECLPYATFLAKAFRVPITLLHVMEPPRKRSEPHAFDAVGWEIARQEAVIYLQRLERQAAEASGQLVDSRVEQGHPAERIRVTGRELSADLTVLGPYGEGGTVPWGLGSTAQQVLARPQGSVLVAHAAARLGVFAPRRILVPLDGSPRTESTLPTVVRLAKESGAELHLAHVVPELVPSGVLRSPEDVEMAATLGKRLEAQAQSYLSDLRNSLAREIHTVTATVTRQADPSRSLLELSQRERIDLIILSAHGSTCDRERSFGSVTTYLLTHSTVPLLALQDLPGSGDSISSEPGRSVRPALRTGEH